jgi:hypothetical protein
MPDQNHIFSQTESVKPSIEIARMVNEPVRLRRRFARLTHPDQIGSKTPTATTEMGKDVAPQIRGCRVSVKEDDRITGPRVDITHF